MNFAYDASLTTPMNFHPFKHQFQALYLKDEGPNAVLALRRGSVEETISFPKALLPLELELGGSFVLSLQPQEAIQKSEAEALKSLLAELIH